MAWICLWIAGLFEILWAIGLRQTVGFTRLVPSLIVFGLMAVSIYLLSYAVKSIPIGTAYAIWTGIGAAGTAVVGIILLGEPVSGIRIFCISLIILGIAGLKWVA